MRKDIENHMKEVCPRRQYECPHCKQRGEYQERTTTHLKTCPKVTIYCPNDGCDVKVQRCKISQHLEECLFELVFCKFTNIGCMEKVYRRDLEKHQNDSEYHFQLAIDKVNQYEDKIARLQPAPAKFKVTNFDQLKTSSKRFYSPAFYTSPGGYKMSIYIDANGICESKGTHVFIFAHLMRGENDDHLPWPLTGTVTFELLNQLRDKHHHSINLKLCSSDKACQRVVNGERSLRGYGISCFIPHSALGYNTINYCQYLRDDCLYFRVKVDTKTTSKPWLVF